jgi:short-subunit dehydrogenase
MVIVITGASSGIGEATALRLAREPGARLVLVARREQRLRALVDRLGAGVATHVAVDLTDEDGPARVRAQLEAEHGGRLDLLVNNAGASWRSTFADGGWENVRRTMAIDFDAQVRLTEALLPLLRASAPSAIVNVASTSGRVARAGTGSYSAAKFAFAGWSDSLWAEERAHGVHVGLVLPGFIRTEGFPQKELPRWLVSEPAVAADAIAEVALKRKCERYVPRYYWLFAALRILTPRLVRRFVGSSAGARMITATRPDASD